jgi:hypothetical protein
MLWANSIKSYRFYFVDDDGGGNDAADDNSGCARCRNTLLPQETVTCRPGIPLWLYDLLGIGWGFVCWPRLGLYSLSALSGSCAATGRFPCAHLVPAPILTLSAKVRFTAYPASKCAGH